jgi:hypothetical protein
MLKGKQPHTRSAIQLYSAANYQENIKEIIRKELQENAVPKNKFIKVIKQKTAEKSMAKPPKVQEHF